MKKQLSYKLIAIACLVLFTAVNGSAQSLFKDYTTTSRQDMVAQTQEMSEKIVKKFNRASIEKNQQKIHFYEYFSNLKKLVLYSSKLATYAQYEDDLKFAKENELFKGLPEKVAEEKKEKRTRFVSEKYKMMKTNIKDEIDTYVDLIRISLDTCEHLAAYDLTPRTMGERNMERIRYYFETSEQFKTYLLKQERLAQTWPDIEAGVQRQLKLWQERGLAPEDPIIDQRITEAVSNEGAV